MCHDYIPPDEHSPAVYCRMCDCNPCACGHGDYRSDAEMEKHRKSEERERDNFLGSEWRRGNGMR